MGKREEWLANFLLMAGGIIVFAATVGIFVAGLLNFRP